MKPNISIAICTYNRFDHLAGCLDTLKAQSLSGDLFEVLVIDNGSDEGARKSFLETYDLSRNCRIVSVAQPGLSKARNIALQEAAAPLIAFIDDDARASETWLKSILDAFNGPHSPKVVFGPIEPIWPNGQPPEWLPENLFGALSVLDLGDTDRPATESEIGFGANIAFDVAAAVNSGGFPENLGRAGKNLMSGEETSLLAEIRVNGGTAWYSAGALVHHFVHEDRLCMPWLISRFAWQAIADKTEASPWSSPEHALEILRGVHNSDDVAKLLQTLLGNENDSPDISTSQTRTALALTSLLLSLHELEDSQVEQLAANRLIVADEFGTPTGEVRWSTPDGYRWAPSISPDTSLLVAEGEEKTGHHYLIPPLQRISGMQEVVLKLNLLRTPCADYTGLFEAAAGHRAQILLPTLDNHLYWTNRITFTAALSQATIPISGILHRLPDNAADEKALKKFGQRLNKIFMLAPELVEICRDRFGLTNVEYLPHIAQHATTNTAAPDVVRKKLGIPDNAIVIAMTGEQRKGKGLTLFLRSLPLISPETRKQIFVILAGKAKAKRIDEIRQQLNDAGVNYLLDLRDNKLAGDFVVINDQDYAERIAVADYGLFLFQDDQREVMSGGISDYLYRGAGLIATESSVVGKIVKRLDAGYLLQEETPRALAKLLNYIVADGKKPNQSDGIIAGYIDSISPDAVARKIEETVGLEMRLEANLD